MAMVFDKKQNESSEDARQAVRLEVGKGVFSLESSVEHRKEQYEGSEDGLWMWNMILYFGCGI